MPGGNYAKITFTNQLANAPIIVTGFQRMGANDFVHYFSASTTEFYLEFFINGSNTTPNTQSLSFIVY